jgi:hypothetical protein
MSITRSTLSMSAARMTVVVLRSSICLRSGHAIRNGALIDTQFWLSFFESVCVATADVALSVNGQSAGGETNRTNAGVAGSQLPDRLEAATGFAPVDRMAPCRRHANCSFEAFSLCPCSDMATAVPSP